MNNIILFGPPGSGKGTQAERLIQEFQLTHISTGIILREAIDQKTLLGKEAKSFIERGQLVPDNVVVNMVKNIVCNRKDTQGFLYDGFPRTYAQAEALDTMLKGLGMKIHKIFFLLVDEEVLIERLLLRGVSSGRQDDADEVVIRARMAEYRSKTEPVRVFYERMGNMVDIDGMQSIDDVYKSIIAKM